MVQQSLQPKTDLQRRQEAERKREKDDQTTVWAFIWTLFVFKMATLLATFWAAAGSTDAAVILIATNWIWIVIPTIAFWGPVTYFVRIRKVRRRRAMMLRSEWMLD